MCSLAPGTHVWVTLPSTKGEHLARVLKHHREHSQVEVAWDPRGDKATVAESAVRMQCEGRATRRGAPAAASLPTLDDGGAATATAASTITPNNNAVSAPRVAAAASSPTLDDGGAATATAATTTIHFNAVSAARVAAACVVERRDFEPLLGQASDKAGKPAKREDGRATMASSTQNRATVEGDTNPQGVQEVVDTATAARSRVVADPDAAGARRVAGRGLLPTEVLRQRLAFLDPLGGTGEVALQARRRGLSSYVVAVGCLLTWSPWAVFLRDDTGRRQRQNARPRRNAQAALFLRGRRRGLSF